MSTQSAAWRSLQIGGLFWMMRRVKWSEQEQRPLLLSAFFLKWQERRSGNERHVVKRHIEDALCPQMPDEAL